MHTNGPLMRVELESAELLGASITVLACTNE